MSAYFYHLLPVEVAVHFGLERVPDRWLGREMTMVMACVPQLFLILAAAALAWGMAKIADRFQQPGESRIKLGTILALMGNMVALPQIVLGFAMADIFVYNAYQVHLPPLWIFAVIFMVGGGIVIGVFFARAIRQEWGRR